MVRTTVSWLLVLVASGSIAAANGPPSGEGLRWRASTSAEHTFEQGLEGPGDVALSRAGLALSFDAPVATGVRAGLFAEYELAHYDFEGATSLVPGRSDPWDDLHRTGLGASLDVRRHERWSFVGRLGVTWAGESDAGVSHALTVQGFGGARWRVRDDLSLTFGLLGLSRLEDDPLVVPILGLDWRITDRLRLFSPGPGLALVATLREGLDLTLAGAWETRDYRLDAGRAGLRAGVVRDDRAPVSLELALRRGAARLALRAGVTVWQEFEIDDRSGDRVARVETDPAPFLGLTGGLRF